METITLHNVTSIESFVERSAFYSGDGDDAESIPSFTGTVCTEDGKEYDFNRLLGQDEIVGRDRECVVRAPDQVGDAASRRARPV